jgi:hypothetical protein
MKISEISSRCPNFRLGSDLDTDGDGQPHEVNLRLNTSKLIVLDRSNCRFLEYSNFKVNTADFMARLRRRNTLWAGFDLFCGLCADLIRIFESQKIPGGIYFLIFCPRKFQFRL